MPHRHLPLPAYCLKSLSITQTLSLSLSPPNIISMMQERTLSATVISPLSFFLCLLLMAVAAFLPLPDQQLEPKNHHSKRKCKQQKPSSSSSSSWDQIKNLLTCKQIEGTKVHNPSKIPSATSKVGYTCSSICSFKDVIHGNTKVVHRADNSPVSNSVGQEASSLSRKGTNGQSTRSVSRSINGSTRGMQLRKFSGCYECHAIVDASRYPVARTAICSCSKCGEVFPKMESLELHQVVRHAVSELGPEDSGRNIVEIIFKSSWLKKDSTVFQIERILKVQNTQRTIQRFEDCREAVKTRALNSGRKTPRCAADGNELLRFHCTSLSCALGAHGSSSLCGSVPGCGVCTIIRHGFEGKTEEGVRTTACSGRAHDLWSCTEGRARRAMLVCRVIAGRVRRVDGDAAEQKEDVPPHGSYDSVSGQAGVYSNLEELIVFNPKAILPCFVVIYAAVES